MSPRGDEDDGFSWEAVEGGVWVGVRDGKEGKWGLNYRVNGGEGRVWCYVLVCWLGNVGMEHGEASTKEEGGSVEL